MLRVFKKVIYTHHNSRINNKLVWNLLNVICDKVIVVNNQSIDTRLIHKSKTEVIPAFIPPYSFKKLPDSLNNEIENSITVISTNCYKYSLF